MALHSLKFSRGGAGEHLEEAALEGVVPIARICVLEGKDGEQNYNTITKWDCGLLK